MQVSTETLSLSFRSADGARKARSAALRAMAATLGRERRPLVAWAAHARTARELRLRTEREAAERQQRMGRKQRSLGMYAYASSRLFPPHQLIASSLSASSPFTCFADLLSKSDSRS